MRFDLVAFDLDGVLVDTPSSWVSVHEHFGVNNDHSYQAYKRGEIDDNEFMRRDIALWHSVNAHVTLADIAEVLDAVPLMPGAVELVRELKALDVRTAIISGGLLPLAERVARQTGIEVVRANGLETDGDGYLIGQGILGVPLHDKGTPLRQVIADAGVDPQRVASIGNSYIDVGMFDESGLGIAFYPIDDQVREGADVVIEDKDLMKVLAHLE